MPPIVTVEEREAVVRRRPIAQPSVTSSALDMDDEDGLPLLEEIAALMRESEAHTTEPRLQQIARIDLAIRFRRFCSEILPVYVARGLTKFNHNHNRDAFSYGDVPALAERLKLFITQQVVETKGLCDHSGAAHVSISSVRQWKRLLIKNVVMYVQEKETLDTYEKALRNVLKHSVDEKQGIVSQLSDHVAYLINRFNLKTASKAPGVYGAPEVQLILNDMFKNLTIGKPGETMLQRIALVQTCFLTGLRVGSLVATDHLDEDRQGMKQSDVSFTSEKPGAWTLHLRATHLKDYNAAEKSNAIRFRMRPLQKPSNILLEPAVLFLLLLLNRGALRADGPDGPVIGSVEQLLVSESYRLVGVGDEPMFRHGRVDRCLTVSDACLLLKKHTASVGLPYGSFHRLRQDFGTQVQTLFGSAMARELMHHSVQHDTLSRHYTGVVELFDLVGIRTGEGAQDATLQATNREEAILSGFAHRCVAISLQQDGTEEREAQGSTIQGTTVPSINMNRRKRRTHEEVVETLLKNNEAFASLHARYTVAAASLEDVRDIKLPYVRNVRGQQNQVDKSLRRLAILDRGKHKEAQEAWSSLRKLRDAMQKERDNDSRKYDTAKKRKRETAVANASSVPITRESIKQARETLKPRRPQVPDRAGFRTGLQSDDIFSRQDANEVNRISGPSRGDGRLPVAARHEDATADATHLVDGVEETAETLSQQHDEAGARDDTFDQGQVIEGELQDGSEDESEAEAIRFRLAWLRFLAGVSRAHERESKLLDFIVAAGSCPLCPFGPNGSFTMSASKERIGLFAGGSGKSQSTAHSYSNPRKHLAKFHPNELTALRVGKQLNPGVAQSPLVPVYAPHVAFQAYPQLAARSLAPISLPGYFDRLTDAQKIVVAKHMNPSIYVDRSNPSQMEWADRVVGKLLTSTPSRTDGTSAEKKIALSEMRSASYPWPQRNPLFKSGPFTGAPGRRYPLPTMHDTGLLPHSDCPTTRSDVKWQGPLLQAIHLPESLVTLPLP